MIVELDIWDNNIVEKISDILNSKNEISKIILNAVLEFRYDNLGPDHSLMSKLLDYCTNTDTELHIITSGHKNFRLLKEYSKLFIHNWPTFWLTLTYTRLDFHNIYEHNKNINLDLKNINVGFDNELKYPFITMNKRPKVHRAILMDMIAKNDLIDKGIVIWREPCIHYEYLYWKERILLVDQKEEFKCQETVPNEYANSFMQIVSESDDTVFILSEKTAIPLFFNKPFLVAGCRHYHRILKEMGFQLYDELFDYSFDDEISTKVRYDLLAKNLKVYQNMSTSELKRQYTKVFEKCVYNKKLALHLATRPELLSDIWMELVEYQKQNNINGFPVEINKFIYSKKDEFEFQQI